MLQHRISGLYIFMPIPSQAVYTQNYVNLTKQNTVEACTFTFHQACNANITDMNNNYNVMQY